MEYLYVVSSPTYMYAMKCVFLSGDPLPVGLVVRSVCWSGERVLAGTKGSEVYEVLVQDQSCPLQLVGGHSEGELWALATHPLKQIFATASDDKSIR